MGRNYDAVVYVGRKPQVQLPELVDGYLEFSNTRRENPGIKEEADENNSYSASQNSSQKGNVTALGSIIAAFVSWVATAVYFVFGSTVWESMSLAILSNILGIVLGLAGIFFIAQAMVIIYAFIKQGGIRGPPWQS